MIRTILRASKLPMAACALGVVMFAPNAQAQTKPVVIAYVFPRDEPLQASQIDAGKLTRINYAFGNVEGGKLLEATAEDAANLATLLSLKQANPTLELLVSIGGWEGSKNFSDAVLTPESRAAFVSSVVSYVSKYKLDGVDIDWEYPGLAGAGNGFRSDDAQHFAEFLKELRAAFDATTSAPGKHLLISIAAGSSQQYVDHADLRAWEPFLDTVNLMSYDYREPTDSGITGNHAPLFDDPADPRPVSTDTSVRVFEAAGVPAKKLVLGVPFYGHVWANVPPKNHGLFQPGSAPKDGYAPYSLIASKWLTSGYTRYWDAASKVPYLYNAKTKEFVSYEDPESLAIKCAYIKQNGLAGVMFWELLGDNGKLLGTIDASFRVGASSQAEGNRK